MLERVAGGSFRKRSSICLGSDGCGPPVGVVECTFAPYTSPGEILEGKDVAPITFLALY